MSIGIKALREAKHTISGNLVTPGKARVQCGECGCWPVDSRFRGNDGRGDGNDRGVAGMSRAIRVCGVWIPAFAGMTGGGDGNDGRARE